MSDPDNAEDFGTRGRVFKMSPYINPETTEDTFTRLKLQMIENAFVELRNKVVGLFPKRLEEELLTSGLLTLFDEKNSREIKTKLRKIYKLLSDEYDRTKVEGYDLNDDEDAVFTNAKSDDKLHYPTVGVVYEGSTKKNMMKYLTIYLIASSTL